MCLFWHGVLATQVMDYGYPQFTEAKILSEYIKTDAHKMEVPCRLDITTFHTNLMRLS